MKKTISIEEQIKLKAKARKVIEDLEKKLQDEDTKKVLDNFKNKFNICETAYKVFLKKYKIINDQKIGESFKINMKQVNPTLKLVGFDFNYQFLNKLFGSSTKFGQKSVKKLRDETTHGIDKSAVKEIIERKDELFGYMDEFIETLKKID